NHAITASYGGDSNFDLSSSSALDLPVDQAVTTTSNVAPSVNPGYFGSSITLTVNLSSLGGVPTGNVEFFDGGADLGGGTLDGDAVDGSGLATLNTSATGLLGVGVHSLTAQYGGDGDFGGSSSATGLDLTVTPASTTSSNVTPSEFPGYFGDSASFTVNVSS